MDTRYNTLGQLRRRRRDGSVAGVRPSDDPAEYQVRTPEGSTADDQAAGYAAEFITKLVRLQGVRIDRTQFLNAELQRQGLPAEMIALAISHRPAVAGVPDTALEAIARSTIEFETRKSSALSFAAGLPGGLAMLATIPGDVTQYYVHAFRVMQKLAYLYGWQSFLDDCDEVSDETLGLLAGFLGVMLGVGGASNAVAGFAAQVVQPAVQKQVAAKALTKTAYYPVIKKTLGHVGVKITKNSFAGGVAKAVPVAGGLVSGAMTYGSLKGQSKRLAAHLRELPTARA